ncbi:hypothetical protein FG05_35384 [Fusarium graminearum]|nr:hypothetical protein FG05_35384 [Fusarium graminearum]
MDLGVFVMTEAIETGSSYVASRVLVAGREWGSAVGGLCRENFDLMDDRWE